jgi:N-acetylglucosamine kinase-like BadF-type ATPase
LARAQSRYSAGFDGGGTRTVCVIADSEGSVLGTGSSGPSNYITAGLPGAQASIRTSFNKALTKAGLRGSSARPSLFDACFGLAGLDSPAALRTMARAVRALRIARRTVVVNDWLTALVGAFVDEPGVVLVAGTGCVAAGQGAAAPGGEHDVVRVGGWGNVVDDRGSAYDIGREALYAAMRAYDGRGPETALLAALMGRLRVKEPQGIIQRVYAEGMAPTEVASLASLVSEAASSGDEVSDRILREKGKLLAGLVVTVASRLKLLDRQFGVALNGGAFNAGPPLLDPMWNEIRASAPLASHIQARFPPPFGALLLLEKDPASRRKLATRLEKSR